MANELMKWLQSLTGQWSEPSWLEPTATAARGPTAADYLAYRQMPTATAARGPAYRPDVFDPLEAWPWLRPKPGPSMDDYEAYREKMRQNAVLEATAGQGRASSPMGPQDAADNATRVSGLPSDPLPDPAMAARGPTAEEYLAFKELMARQAQLQANTPLTVAQQVSQRAMQGGGPQEAIDNAHAQATTPQPVDAATLPLPRGRSGASTASLTPYRRAEQPVSALAAMVTPSGPRITPGAPIPDAAPAPAAAPAADPATTAAPDDPSGSIREKMDMLDALYPKYPDQNVGQGAIDAEMERERQRSNYLAQLAFFSGITAGAGGSWESVGRGMAASGGAYSEGFDRYQKALEKKADRMQRATDSKYRYDLGKTDAAVTLYTADEDRKDKRRKDAYETLEDLLKHKEKRLEKEVDAKKPTDLNPGDPEALNDIFRRWDLSMPMGVVSTYDDVSDKNG